MPRVLTPISILLLSALLASAPARSQTPAATWSFAVSGDSRNCGDFVMPAIAAKVKVEEDAFYWHLGDFRWMTFADQDMEALQPAGTHLGHFEYQRRAWDDFLMHQTAAFGAVPVFLGRGNHENVMPMNREDYIVKFSGFLNRPEIAAQRKADSAAAAPLGPWYHWTQNGVDFITLDNASHDEFTDTQLHWLRAVLDRDLAPNSGIRAIVAGMHEALPHSTASSHAMDDWSLGTRTGEQVYEWFYQAQAAGKNVYLLASHSHYYSPNIFASAHFKQQGKVVPGWIIGLAGAHRYKLPVEADPASRTNIYGFMQGTVRADGTIDFVLREVAESDLVRARWPGAPLDAIHECVVHNADN